ncbi:IS200/IS605 family transposase [Megasphaera elsdenii]|uniref:IS200/IS605 family transposase n=1 Tax=Megasphaera elsdenii TaxID=907 RepID=UPI0039B53790
MKYRHKVLTPESVEDLVQILEKVANDNDFEILELNTDKDHVYILIDCSPQHFIPDIMKAIKGVSARLLMKKHGDTLRKKLWGGHL